MKTSNLDLLSIIYESHQLRFDFSNYKTQFGMNYSDSMQLLACGYYNLRIFYLLNHNVLNFREMHTYCRII